MRVDFCLLNLTFSPFVRQPGRDAHFEITARRKGSKTQWHVLAREIGGGVPPHPAFARWPPHLTAAINILNHQRGQRQ